MTKAEGTGYRNLAFSRWSREKLKNSANGLVWTDIDGFFMDYQKKRLLLVEFKNGMARMTYAQENQYLLLDRCLKYSAKAMGFEYWGFYELRMSGSSPGNSNYIFLNDSRITETELIKLLNFETPPSSILQKSLL